MSKRTALWGLVAGWIVLASAAGYAAAVENEPEPPVYRPVTSDLMSEIIQPRHIKLWLAGKAQNWIFADYERHNLQGAFRRWSVAIPEYHGAKVADMIDAFTSEPFAELDAAIKAKDEAAFVKAYGALTDACNNCHQGVGQGMAVIKVPGDNAFPDQDFNPREP